VLIGLNLQDIEKKYKVDRDASLPTGRPTVPWTLTHDIDLASYEGKYLIHYSIKAFELEMKIMLDM
jgi:hypothetical protein